VLVQLQLQLPLPLLVGVDDMSQQRRELLELLDVQMGELLDAASPLIGQLEAHHPGVVAVAVALDETACLGAVDELDGAVVAEEEVRRDVADRRPAADAARG
jgi:hypothetical protein